MHLLMIMQDFMKLFGIILHFPEDGNYAISTMVDDNVVLTFSGKSPLIKKILY